MTEAEQDAILATIQAEVTARYKGAQNELETLAMMLQDFNVEAAKRIPGWRPFDIATIGETAQ